MDEAKPKPGRPGDRSQAAAEKLRALRERANSALDDHRRRLAQLETQLHERVQQLAEEYAPPAGDAPAQPDPAATEITELRRQLDEGRAKHERFVEQLAAARRQLEELQTQPCPHCQQAEAALAAARHDYDALRAEHQAAQRHLAEEHARHDKFAEQLAQARAALTELQNASGDRAAELSVELDAARAAEQAARGELAAAKRDLEISHLEFDAQAARAAELEKCVAEVGEEHAAALALAGELEASRNAADAEIAQLKQRVDALTTDNQAALDGEAALEEQLAASRTELDQMRAACEAAELAQLTAIEEAARQTAALEKLRQEHDAQHAAATNGLTDAQAEVAELRRRLSSAESDQAVRAQALADATAQRDELQRQVARLEATNRELAETASTLQTASDAEAVSQSAELELARTAVAAARRELAELAAARDAAEAASSEARAELAALRTAQASADERLAALTAAEAEAARLTGALQTAEAELAHVKSEYAALRAGGDATVQLEQLQHKFDLALADVQKLKRDNEALREELAERPAAGAQESPELIAARSERDALAERVAELEAAAAAAPAAAATSELADLQRRFEMAVDDVRQLKLENAQLKEKAGKASTAAPRAGGSSGANDWAAQRARLMAMLEAEDGADAATDPARRQERATIDETLAATDRALAAKDEELASLRSALESQGAGAKRSDEAVIAVLDADAIIAAERRRLVELQAQWEEKVRQAELEISVERAKIARDQNALKERALTLSAAPAGAEDGGPGGPRRRWLAALGLGDDIEDAKKKKK